MKNRFFLLLIIFLCSAAGCATMYQAEKVGPTAIVRAQEEIPEDHLLDVGILVFESVEVTEERAEKEGTTPEIREAEIRFMPFHLKQALQRSSHWGAVRVIPHETACVDTLVKGKVIASNGERLVLEIQATDSTGREWFKKRYEREASEFMYMSLERGERDAFQDLYNTIANELTLKKMELTSAEISDIRMVSKLKFAEDFSPEAFTGYLTKNKDEKITINRLPAEDDPMMGRLLKVREREYMFVDTLNQYYEDFYDEMWMSYENWRKLNLQELTAMRKIKREAVVRQIVGALMMAGAAALAIGDVGGTGGLQAGMFLVGSQVVIDGINVSKEADMNADVVKELGESFASEMKPVVMDIEGKQYELTGSAEEQFMKWRRILREIYYAETGFDPNEPGGVKAPQDSYGP